MSALLTTFGIDWHLLTAQVINFVILAIALTWLLYKPVLKMVREREQIVAKGVADAEESARILAEADHKAIDRVKIADTEAEKIVAAARDTAGSEKARILKEAEARAASVTKEAEARAAEARAQATRESERDIARLAVLAAEKVLRERL